MCRYLLSEQARPVPGRPLRSSSKASIPRTCWLGKWSHGDAHTTWARGRINGALETRDPEDSWAIHAADTLNEGHLINDPAKVETVAEQMPTRLRELEEWGMDFSRTESGEIDQRYFGAQSFRRTAFAGDHTGESLMETLVDRAQELSIPYEENTMIASLLTDDGAVEGAVGVDLDTGEFVVFNAGVVVLAAGGYAAIYKLATVRKKTADLDVGSRTDESFEFAVDLKFMLVAAEAVLQGALQRTESRGAHHRTDHPETDPTWQRNILYTTADLGRMTTDTRPVDSPSETVQEALNEGHELDYHQLE